MELDAPPHLAVQLFIFRRDSLVPLAGLSCRPIGLLLSDGVDTARLTTKGDVYARAAQRPDLAIFPLGVNLPDIASRGPGPITPKKFLDNLARHTDGEFLNVPTAGGLAAAVATRSRRAA